MAVAHDAATETTFTFLTSPSSFNHTPSGTPRGVLVFIAQTGGSSTEDVITGVTYGGTAMTRVQVATDTATEVGWAWVYFLGSSIPTGTQSVSVSYTGATNTHYVVCCTLTASADTEVAASGVAQESQADPQIALDSGADSALRYCGIFSGQNALTSLAILSGMSAVLDHDFGINVASVDRQTTAGSGSFTIGYTAASDDVAMVAVAVKEVAASGFTTTAAPTLPSMTASGTAKQAQSTTAAPSLASLTASGTATQAQTTTAAATFPALTSSATVVHEQATTATPSLAALTASATAKQTQSSTGAATLPALTASATAEQAVTGFATTVAATLPALTASASAAQPFTTTATPALPALTAAAQSTQSLPTTAASSLPALTASASALHEQITSVAAVLPFLTTAALLTHAQRLTGAASLPSLTAAAVATGEVAAATPHVITIGGSVGATSIVGAVGAYLQAGEYSASVSIAAENDSSISLVGEAG